MSTEKKRHPYISLLSKQNLLEYEGCSSSNQDTTDLKFYICSLQDSSTYILCEFCKKKCHGDHDYESIHRLINESGEHKCQCAIDNHKKCEKANSCFYQKICKFLPNVGYYNLDGINYCPICTFACNTKKVKNKRKLKNEEVENLINNNKKICQCQNHIMGNSHLIQSDMYRHKKLTGSVRNLNFNIFGKDNLLKKICIDYLVNYIIKCKNAKLDNIRLQFLDDSNIQDILRLFYIFSMHFRNKYFYILSSLIEYNDIEKEDESNLKFNKELFQEEIILSSIPSPPGSLNKYKRLKAQMYLANLLFSYKIRKFHIENFNKWNIYTIQNMNIYQRFDLIINATNKVNNNEFEDYKKIINIILDIYEKILKEHSSDYNLVKDMKKEILPCFCKTIKYVIKYHLFSNEKDDSFYDQVCTIFFDLISKTIDILREIRKKEELEIEEKEKNEKKLSKKSNFEHKDYNKELALNETCFKNRKLNLPQEDIDNILNDFSLRSFNNENKESKELIVNDKDESFNFSDSSPTLILKAIFYFLLYSNDKRIKKLLDKKTKNFSCIINDPPYQINNIQNIFYSIFNEFSNIAEGKNKEVFDEISKLIFSFMFKKENNFYYLQFNNLKIIDEQEKYFELNKLNQNHKEYLDKIIEQLRINSRKYFTYAFKYKDYCERIELILQDFQLFILNNFKLENLELEYLCFVKKANPHSMKKIKEFQKIVNNSNLFIALEEIIQIIGQASNFLNREFSENTKIIPSLKIRKFLLKFLYLMMYRNYDNTTLILNFNGNSFALFFDFAQKEFFDFMNRVIEICFSTEYYFANFQFLIKVIKGLKVSICKFRSDKFISLLADYIIIIDNILKHLNNYRNLYFDFSEILKDGLSLDTGTKKISKVINDYLEDPKKEKYNPDNYSNSFVEKLVINYIQYAGNILESDISKYIINLNSIDYISYNILNKNFIEKIRKNEIDFNPLFIYPIIKYTILKKKPFYLNFIMSKEYMKNIFSAFNDKAINYKSKNVEFFVAINQYPYKEINEDNFPKIIEKECEIVFNFFEFLNCILIHFKDYMQIYIENGNTFFNSYLQLKVFLFRFFEFLIKNLFFGIKCLEVYLSFIEGKKYKLLFEIINNMLYVIELFYLNINKIEDIITQDSNHIEYRIFENSKIFHNIERFSIIINPNHENLIKKIRKLSSKIASFDFYEVSSYCKYFESVLQLIVFDAGDLVNLSIENPFIDNISNKYLEALNGENEFINFQDDSIGIKIILDYGIFKIFENEKLSSLNLEKIPCLHYLINILGHFSDLNYKKSLSEKEKLKDEMSESLSKIINPYLHLMCFSVLCENIKMLELPRFLHSFNIHCNINVLMTRFFQILCEGNMISMKQYLFEQKLNVEEEDINDKKSIEKYLKLKINKNINEAYFNIIQDDNELKKKVNIEMKKVGFEKQKIDDSIKYNFFNILSQNMVFLVKNFNQDEKTSLLPLIYKKTNEYFFKNITKMFGGYKDLLIEMIQGYDFKEDIFL